MLIPLSMELMCSKLPISTRSGRAGGNGGSTMFGMAKDELGDQGSGAASITGSGGVDSASGSGCGATTSGVGDAGG